MSYKDGLLDTTFDVKKTFINCPIVFALAGARSEPCNRSYCEAGIRGWLEDRSPPRRLLEPLEQPQLT